VCACVDTLIRVCKFTQRKKRGLVQVVSCTHCGPESQ